MLSKFSFITVLVIILLLIERLKRYWLQKSFFFIFVFISMYVSACHLSVGTGASDPPGAEVTDSCELLIVGAGIELESSAEQFVF